MEELVKKVGRLYRLSALIFFVAAGIGFFYGIPNDLEKAIHSMATPEKSFFAEVFEIFFHNTMGSIASIALGALTFGIVPVVDIIVNGLKLGFIVDRAYDQGVSIGGILAGLLPHGIIEITMILVTSALGMLLGFSGYRNIFRIKRKLSDAEKFAREAFFKVVIPWMLLAAVVESSITPWMMSFFE